jgi:hypothetical protein
MQLFGSGFLKKILRFVSWLEGTRTDQLTLVKQLALQLSDKRASIKASGFDNSVLKEILFKLATRVVKKTNITPKKPPYNYHPYGRGFTTPDYDFSDILQLLDFCTKFPKHVALASKVLRRFETPPAGTTPQDWISKYLMEFVPKLDSHLKITKQDLVNTPYAEFCTTVTRAFFTTILGPKPPESDLPPELKNFGCSGYCSECMVLRKFFADVTETMNLPRPQSTRTHLERELARVRTFGITWTTIRRGSPHNLVVRSFASTFPMSVTDFR